MISLKNNQFWYINMNMMMSWHQHTFCNTGPLCVCVCVCGGGGGGGGGGSTGHQWFLYTKGQYTSFDAFFVVRLLKKPSSCRTFGA